MLRRLLALPGDERLSLLQAAVLLPVVQAGLHVVSCARLRAALDAVPARSNRPALARERVGWAVDAADARVPGDRSCLERALVGEALLRRRGYESALRFGVDGTDPEMAAHAWVESGGEVVVGAETREAYTRLEASDSG